MAAAASELLTGWCLFGLALLVRGGSLGLRVPPAWLFLGWGLLRVRSCPCQALPRVGFFLRFCFLSRCYLSPFPLGDAQPPLSLIVLLLDPPCKNHGAARGFPLAWLPVCPWWSWSRGVGTPKRVWVRVCGRLVYLSVYSVLLGLRL